MCGQKISPAKAEFRTTGVTIRTALANNIDFRRRTDFRRTRFSHGRTEDYSDAVAELLEHSRAVGSGARATTQVSNPTPLVQLRFAVHTGRRA